MNHQTPKSTPSFLSGGGEMGELIRQKDWDNSPLGSPEQWTQSLRTTLSIILNSKFPMFLFWGPELICFYNDAYRPSLGNNGKHPDILGGRAKDYWVEIWADIKPIIDQVLSGGEANWSEDQLLPIYRNGKMEDVYWTFSYSAVYDESGKPGGVIQDITQSKESEQILKESEKRFHRLADHAPMWVWITDLDINVLYANYEVLNFVGISHYSEFTSQIWQKSVHPDHLLIVMEHFSKAIAQQTAFEFEACVKNAKTGNYEWFYLKGIPRVEADIFTGFIGTAININEQKIQLKKIQQSEENFRQLSDLMPEKVSMSDSNGNVIYYNKSWLDYTGLSFEDLKDSGWMNCARN